MKQGFTLAELLGVITILGIISLIAVPLIGNTINQRNEDLYQTQLNQIIKGAKSYYSDNLSKLPKDDGNDATEDTAAITLQELQKTGYLPLDIENPKTKQPFSPSLTVKVTNVDGSRFEYEIIKSTIGD